MNGLVVFDKTIVEEHRLAKNYKSDLDSICKRDYGKAFFNARHPIACIDMDSVEESLWGRKDCTMDAAIGICDYQDGIFQKTKFALVELKLGKKSTNNIGITHLGKKISHTKQLLPESSFHSTCYFVYPENLYQRVKSEFEKEARTQRRDEFWDSVSPSAFLTKIRFREDISSAQVMDVEELKRTFYDSFFPNPEKAYDFYCKQSKKMIDYRLQHYHSEADTMLQSMYEVITSLNREDNPRLAMICEMIEDDIKRKRRMKY